MSRKWRPERHHSNPWSEELLHAMGQLGPCATATELLLLSLGATTTEPVGPRTPAPQWEKPLQWEAHAPTREKPVQQQRPNMGKSIYLIF